MNKIGLLSDEQREQTINDIVDYFETELDQEIGVIAAENLLDFFLESLGNKLYNKGVDDTKKFLEQSFETLKIEIEATVKK